MKNDLLMVIAESLPTFSKGHKLIANYIISHFDKAAFMTASKLGTVVGVSESTVVRFATELGFEGYPELQRAIQDLMRNKLTAMQRIEVTTGLMENHDILNRVLNQDIDRIRRTLDETSTEDFYEAVDKIVNCESIYIIGARSSSAVARFMEYYFNLIFKNVKLVRAESTSEMFEQIMRIGKNDVMIGISFPRYSKQTVIALKYAADNGANVISITDSKSSPIVQYSNNVLLARSDMVSFVDSLVAPLSLINALIVAVSIKTRDKVADNLEKLERIWDEYDVYEKSKESEG